MVIFSHIVSRGINCPTLPYRILVGTSMKGKLSTASVSGSEKERQEDEFISQGYRSSEATLGLRCNLLTQIRAGLILRIVRCLVQIKVTNASELYSVKFHVHKWGEKIKL